MAKLKMTDWWDRFFALGIILKGIDGALELLCGLLLLIIRPEQIQHLAILATQPELSNNPDDFIATHILHTANNLNQHTLVFSAFYLLVHGVVKLVLVIALLRDKLWAYPWMIVVLSLFIVYQFYQIALKHSVGLSLLTILDIVIVVLTWHEYVRQRKQREAAAAQAS